jgi:hypothetical protein
MKKCIPVLAAFAVLACGSAYGQDAIAFFNRTLNERVPENWALV